jgi:hypothetical protein
MATIIIPVGDKSEAHSITNLPKVSQLGSDRDKHIEVEDILLTSALLPQS